MALSSVMTAIHAQDADPRQIAAAIVAGPTTGPPTPLPANLPQAPPTTAYSFNDLIMSWAAERKHLGSKTVYEVQHIAGKLAKFLGHEEATVEERVNAAKAYELTKDDFIRWKEDLIKARLSAETIKKNINMIKEVFRFAAANIKIAVDPTLGVTYQAKRNPRKPRIGYRDADAAKILLAARQERDPLRRWTPWVCAFTGCRLDEIVSAMVRDIERFGDIYVLANAGAISRQPRRAASRQR